MKKITLLIFGLMTISISNGQNCTETELDSIYEITHNYFTQGKCEEAIPLLSEMLINCTSESDIHRITDKILNCYFATNQFDKFYDIIEFGHNHGVVYRFPPFFKQSLDEKRYTEMVKRNDSILHIQKINATASYDIVLPDQFNKDLEYPLFIVLTKGTRTKKVLIDAYRSTRIKNDFIIAFMHSSDFKGTNFYQWHNVNERRPEIENMFNEIKNKYKIDTSKIIIGGMSNCGEMAIDMTFRGSIPITGFIGICPTNAGISYEEITQKSESVIKGIIVAGKNDKRFLKSAENMSEIFRRNGFPLIYEIGDFGHQIPKDSYMYIDKAISYFYDK